LHFFSPPRQWNSAHVYRYFIIMIPPDFSLPLLAAEERKICYLIFNSPFVRLAHFCFSQFSGATVWPRCQKPSVVPLLRVGGPTCCSSCLSAALSCHDHLASALQSSLTRIGRGPFNLRSSLTDFHDIPRTAPTKRCREKS